MTGVPEDMVTAPDFIQVRAALVQLVGGANEALVWERVNFRSCDDTRAIEDDDGGRAWWPASSALIAAETGLSVDQVDRALRTLRQGGFVESTEHRLGGNYDRTKSWRVVVNSRGVDSAESRNGDRGIADRTPRNRGQETAESRNVPSYSEERSTSDVADATIREEVVMILDYLDAAIERNGAKKPARTKKNIDAARRLLDIDERTPTQVRGAIDWATSDPFWRSNILSMTKLREKYDQLRLSAQRSNPTQNREPAYAGREEYTPPE